MEAEGLPPLMASDKERGRACFPFVFFSGYDFLCTFFYDFLGAHLFFLGTGLGAGQRGACNVPPLHGLRTNNVRRHR